MGNFGLLLNLICGGNAIMAFAVLMLGLLCWGVNSVPSYYGGYFRPYFVFRSVFGHTSTFGKSWFPNQYASVFALAVGDFYTAFQEIF